MEPFKGEESHCGVRADGHIIKPFEPVSGWPRFARTRRQNRAGRPIRARAVEN